MSKKMTLYLIPESGDRIPLLSFLTHKAEPLMSVDTTPIGSLKGRQTKSDSLILVFCGCGDWDSLKKYIKEKETYTFAIDDPNGYLVDDSFKATVEHYPAHGINEFAVSLRKPD